MGLIDDWGDQLREEAGVRKGASLVEVVNTGQVHYRGGSEDLSQLPCSFRMGYTDRKGETHLDPPCPAKATWMIKPYDETEYARVPMCSTHYLRAVNTTPHLIEQVWRIEDL